MKKIIELKNISKAFDGETVLDNINLDIYDNEFLTLLGPSGCGKTTTLRIIGGRLINPVQFGVERQMSDIVYFATALPAE